MSNSSSLRTFAPIWVGVSALAVIVWELAAHSSMRYAAATTAIDPDFVRVSLSTSAQSAVANPLIDSLDVDSVPTWESQHRSIEVRIDPQLGRRGIRDQDFRAVDNPHVSARSYPFSYAQLLANGQLDVVSGYGDGFTGKKTELRFSLLEHGWIACEAATSNFCDTGPFFDDFWTELTGNAVISTNTWKRGDVLFVEYEVCGVRNGVSLVDSGRLRVELPR